MSEWPMTTLGELIHVKHGYAFKGEHFAETGDKLVLKPGNFPVGGGIKLRPGKDNYYSGVYPAEFELAPGAMLVVMTDLTQAAPILGSPAFVPDEPVMLHNQRLGLVQIKPGVKVDERFLYYSMLSESARGQVRATATGATVRHTAPERLYRVRIGFPDIGVQRSVGEILSSIDDLIENNRRRVAVLEEMARAIYREWFVKFRYPGHEDVPLVDSALGPIPEGWELSTCGAELTFIGGGTPSKSEPSYWDGGDISWYTPTDLTKTGWRYTAPSELAITAQGLAKSSARLFPAGSVMMTSRATLGVLAIATTEATTNQGFIVILPDERWNPGFIYEWLDSKGAELSALGTGATFKEITKGSFKSFPFVVPTQSVLDDYRVATEPLENQVHVLEQQTRSLSALRDLLLPKLVTGQIDVSALDLDALLAEGVGS